MSSKLTLLVVLMVAAVSLGAQEQRWVTCQKGFLDDAPIAVFPDSCPYGWHRV